MSKNIWEINNLSSMKHETFEGTHVWYMDDFYKYPDLVFEEITSNTPPLWKTYEKNTFNSIYFEDRRHLILIEELDDVYIKLGRLIDSVDPGRGATDDFGYLTTNHTLFYKDEKSLKFNDYKSNWWWPHIDGGYNGICYLNKNANNEIGTNLYRRLKEDPEYNDVPEHRRPWIPFEYWKRVAAFRAKFNRFVLFDGREYFHGMNIEDDRYFHEFRVNQVFFFKDPDYSGR
jgi:hypothetical protein